MAAAARVVSLPLCRAAALDQDALPALLATAPWIVPEELWELLKPLLSTGIAWEQLPQELGFGCGVSCWRRLEEWQRAGVWARLHELLLAKLRAAGELERD